jgi:hypothetical protein
MTVRGAYDRHQEAIGIAEQTREELRREILEARLERTWQSIADELALSRQRVIRIAHPRHVAEVMEMRQRSRETSRDMTDNGGTDHHGIR